MSLPPPRWKWYPRTMEKLIDALEDNDDVQNVYHNWEQE